ncbi:NADP-dependent malic enzyme [Coccomyxa subellipsoidea C-169]|uniref:Malic enzyme n=1 Tax=Coccomyxa subellipsoidea (strain C-169) TaxID=574566 RepID=I0YZZ1_COCSC|nr:NADP-dependent malic enzyme [Coccomyxa subellipsoidea C-169]EIE23960.1 NADP-dependent malic enzyme [Coccomyxa subellipsoidea C-169]|eukprot:XP_005648504.1 NADP-dependent malic enzyme [Coccomyxa subellipsoidea C-169]
MEVDPAELPITPWVRSVISGCDVMRNPKYNKGLAFSEEERGRLYLRGLLPPAVLSQEVQAERCMINIRSKSSDLERHSYLTSLQERNESLFYYVLSNNIEELLPIVHMPTVSEYCQTYGLMFKSLPRSLFICMKDKGRVYSLLKNWPERRIKAICLTDGERVGALGDLGVQAVGVPVSKLALYSACAGIPPNMCLPVCIDAGTDNEELLQSQFYVGSKHKRVRGDVYYELLDEFISAAKRRFGNTVLVHFEDMSYANLSRLFNQYRGSLACFSDDVQGTAAVVLAGILAAQPLTGKSLADHTIMIAGDGAAGTALAELLAEAIARQNRRGGGTIVDARRQFWLVDRHGLVTRGRADADSLPDHALPYCHEGPPCADLAAAVAALRPSVLIGVSDGAPSVEFTRGICEELARINSRPIIMPLSLPEPELRAEDAYEWTGGKAVFADRVRRTSASAQVSTSGGQSFTPGCVETAYIFPGIGLGSIVSRATRLRDEAFIAAAEALASLVTDEDRARGSIYPPLRDIRTISAKVACAVAKKAYESGVATALPRPHDVKAAVRASMYRSTYRKYR